MRPPMILAFCFSLFLGCSADTPTDPGGIDTTRTEPPSSFFVSVDGSDTGDGSSAQPWSLATALAHPGAVKPGDTIWLRGGTYRTPGNFVSTLTGTASAPIVLRQFPGERATIDARQLTIQGHYTYYWGFEVTYSNTQRVTSTAGSHPPDADMPRHLSAVFSSSGHHNKLINLIVHDLGNGISNYTGAQGTEIYGCIVYNNGWIGPDRGHGHSFYLQNQIGRKLIEDNVLFNSFSSGLKIGGSEGSAYLLGFDVIGNSSFLAGGPALAGFSYQLALDLQGGLMAGNNTFDRNSFYFIGQGLALRLGINSSPMEPYPIEFTNNIVHGGIFFDTWPSMTMTGNKIGTPTVYDASGDRFIFANIPLGAARTNYVVDNNAYSYPLASLRGPFYLKENGIGATYSTIADWRAATGWDAKSTLAPNGFTGTDIVFRPNRYEPGRATITVWNWNGSASSASVDVSSLLTAGDTYTVHHVYDFFGPPVASGTYSGVPISLPLRNYTPPTPIGMTSTPPSAGIEFNVFIIRKS